jgi:hypothetical protein
MPVVSLTTSQGVFGQLGAGAPVLPEGPVFPVPPLGPVLPVVPVDVVVVLEVDVVLVEVAPLEALSAAPPTSVSVEEPPIATPPTSVRVP